MYRAILYKPPPFKLSRIEVILSFDWAIKIIVAMCPLFTTSNSSCHTHEGRCSRSWAMLKSSRNDGIFSNSLAVFSTAYNLIIMHVIVIFRYEYIFFDIKVLFRYELCLTQFYAHSHGHKNDIKLHKLPKNIFVVEYNVKIIC